MTTRKLDEQGKPYAVDLNEHLENKFKDPEYAIEYLRDTLRDQEVELFLAALGDIAKVTGIKNVAEGTGLNRESLYRMLSTKGNPTFKNILEVLSKLGLELSISHKASKPDFSYSEAYHDIEKFVAVRFEELFSTVTSSKTKYRHHEPEDLEIFSSSRVKQILERRVQSTFRRCPDEFAEHAVRAAAPIRAHSVARAAVSNEDLALAA